METACSSGGNCLPVHTDGVTTQKNIDNFTGAKSPELTLGIILVFVQLEGQINLGQSKSGHAKT